MKKSTGNQGHGIDLSGSHITDLDFVDDIALMANDPVTLWKMTSSLQENGAQIGLRINAENIMSVGI